MYRILGSDQREYGPATDQQVRQWICERRLNGRSLAARLDAGRWQPLASFPEFSEVLQFGGVPPPLGAPWVHLQTRTHPMALAGFIMGVLTITLGGCCCYGVPFNVLGVVFSAIALSEINRHPESAQGKGLAVGGLVLSIVGTVAMIGLFSILGLAQRVGELLRHFRG